MASDEFKSDFILYEFELVKIFLGKSKTKTTSSNAEIYIIIEIYLVVCINCYFIIHVT